MQPGEHANRPAVDGQLPLVSVIIAAFNAEAYLKETCLSVLSQTYPTIELIVVDDGSTDGTAAVVRTLAASDSRIRLIQQENRGVAAARNAAIAQAAGEFIAPLDADDVWDRTKIARQVERLQACGPGTGIAYCWWAWIDDRGAVLDRSPRWQVEGRAVSQLAEVNFTGSASVPLYRRSCLDEIGAYDVTLQRHRSQGCEDWELALRVAGRWDVAVVPAVLVGYRRRTDSMSAQCDTMWRSHLQIMAALAERDPSISKAVLRRSSGQFALHLAGVAFWSGDYVQAFRWGFRAPWTLSITVMPYVLRLLTRRLLRLEPTRPILSSDGGRFDESGLREPLIPYDRIYARHWHGQERE
jgi:glycosyltransferase involved in cell wall biosynthesis